MTDRMEVNSAIQDVIDWMREQIDGGDECKRRDSIISGHISTLEGLERSHRSDGMVAVKGYVFWNKEPWADKAEYIWREFKPDDSETRVFIGAQTVMFHVPKGFDPRGKQVDALNAKKQELTAKFQAAVTEINARINNLTALEA